MKFKHIIGLDIGTNSLGWCLIKEYEDGAIEIVKTGVHIFPIGTIVDDKSNKEKTKNEQRRAHRGASRMRYRFKMRRENLKGALENLKMYPDYSKYLKAKGTGQSYELYKLRADAIDSKIKIPLKEIGRIFMLLNKYRGFKSNAKKLGPKDSEAGTVKKGYESLQKLIDNSNSETIGQYFFKMHEKAKKLYDENKWHNFNEPIDERAYNDIGEIVLFKSNGIRRHHGRYTLRDMYLLEFDKIWEAQKNHYPTILTGSKKEYDEIISLAYAKRIKALKEFRKTNYWHIREYCIYYQRPLKSQKKYVSNCQFERGFYKLEKYNITEAGIEKIKEKRIWQKKAKKACPKSHPLFQEFRIWQKLHQINYSSTEEDSFKAPLKKEWLPVLCEFLMYNTDVYLNETKKARVEKKEWIGKLLQEKGFIKNSDNYSFYIDKADEDNVADEKNENKITGNITYATFKEALGNDIFFELKNKVVTRKEQINKAETIDVTETKLFYLWHHLYIAKDGLFKEDEWLKCILTEPSKWNLSNEQATKLIESGLQPDYCSYSSKVLKAILPYMRKGLNEHEALKETGKRYINDDNTVGRKVLLKENISQLAYQELRNPVVERSLSKTMKLVNTILERHKNEIDKEKLEIRIESTRQLRKPRQERENERKKNADKDKLREQYAKFLTSKKNELGFIKDIQKYDSLINKYELWLQMNMNEDDEVFIKEFKTFSKITKKEDKLKHKLWLECGRLCPYTGKTINLTDCFSSEIEIEHIIPLSRSLDDSFNNKTLTYRFVNAEKGCMTPLEYLNKKGENDLMKFKNILKGKHHDFSDSKKKQFLAEKVDESFLHQQLSNTSYIAKYTRTKIQEVCKNVQFTNGSVTAELRNRDWALSNLLDKIRYEEEFKVNIDEYYKKYYSIKKDFIEWYKKQFNTTDFKIDWTILSENKELKQYISLTNNDLLYWNEGIERFNKFRNKSGKKDRSDHRHHAIDAFVTACCSPKIIKALSTANALKENNKLAYRDRIEKSFDYEQLKIGISNILVSHSEKQILIKKRKNKIKRKNGITQHYTYAPQGSLHKETFYGKLKTPLHQGFSKDDVFVGRSLLMSKNGSSEAYSFEKSEATDKIYEENQKEIIKQRFEFISDKMDEKGNKIKPFSEKSMKEYPIYSYTPNSDKTKSLKGKTLPVIKSIRTKYKNEKSLIQLPNNKYADKDGNYLMVLYETKKIDKKGIEKRPTRDFKLISFWDGVNSKTKKQKLFIDETEEGVALYKECNWLQKGDLVFINNEKTNVNWDDNIFISSKLYRVNEIGINPTGDGYASIKLEPHKQMKKAENKYTNKGKFLKLSESLNATKIRLSILGEIVAKGEECF